MALTCARLQPSAEMEQLSGQTGGAVYMPKSTTELNDAFVQIAADLAHQYVLSYYPERSVAMGVSITSISC